MTKVQQLVEENVLRMANGNEQRARELYEIVRTGRDIDALAIRTKAYEGVNYCARCGKPLDGFKVYTNGVPHCLLPCEVS